MSDRPEDIANRDFYNNHMPTRRARVVVEADVRFDSSDDGLDFLTDAVGLLDGVSVRNPLAVSTEWISHEVRVNGQPATYDAETDTWTASLMTEEPLTVYYVASCRGCDHTVQIEAQDAAEDDVREIAEEHRAHGAAASHLGEFDIEAVRA